MTHAWCSDPSRDAAVRAAEDGRTGALPTLEEAIVRPFAEAAERSVEVSKTGEGQSGMRTERVTLEVTYDNRISNNPHAWNWSGYADAYRVGGLLSGESVRVVEETHFDDLAQVAMERDAAIRELSAEKMWRDNLAMQRNEIRDERDKLRARVDELETRTSTAGEGLCEAPAASGGGEGEPVAWGVIVGGKIDQHAGSDALFVDNEEAQEWCHDAAISSRGTVVPLYRAPPQPRGWLSDKERHWIDYCRLNYALPYAALACLDAILARSSPPEVVLPPIAGRDTQGVPCVRLVEVRWALAAAGVAVKEVPCD